MSKPLVLIAPFAKKLRNGKNNPKNYPYWEELVALLQKDYEVAQLGITGEPELTEKVFFNKSLDDLKGLLNQCYFWISVDSFLPHLAYHTGKQGIVIWSVSDPLIFGYKENMNILQNRNYLRKNQFDIWETQEYSEKPFLPAKDLYYIISRSFNP